MQRMESRANASPEVSSGSSSTFTLSSPRSSDEVERDLIWTEIDLGERYLVSAMYEDAASVSSSTLRKLCRGSSMYDSEYGSIAVPEAAHHRLSEGDNMIEAAGMVLLQAYNEIGRVQELFEVLESTFGPVAVVPPSLFLAAVCLEISAGLFVPSRVALEKYLRGWTTVVGAPSIMVKQSPSAGTANISEEAGGQLLKANCQDMCKLYLSRRQYADLAEIYAVHVLVKGFRNSESALDWLRQADLLEERKLEIIKKVYTISQPQRAGNRRSLSNTQVISRTAETTSKLEDRSFEDDHPSPSEEHFDVNSDSTKADEKVAEGKIGTSKKTQSLAIAKLVRSFRSSFFSELLHKVVRLIVLRLGFISSLPRRAQQEGTRVAMGGFSLVLLYALLKERRLVLGILRDLFRKANTGFCDFWQLAFSVQLNPLAAVQPLPSSRVYGSRFA